MKLNEILKTLVDSEKISSEESKSISTAIDAIKTKAVKEVTDKNETLSKELNTFKAEERNTHINKLVSDLTDEDKVKDAIELAKLTLEDTDEEIIKKVNSTIETRKYLQKSVIGEGESHSSISDRQEAETKTVHENTSRVISGVAV